MDLKALDDLILMLRKRGVRSFRVEGDESFDALELSLDPDPTPPLPIKTAPSPSEAVASDEHCRCGHASYQHVNELCVVGCDVEACAPPEKEKDSP